MKTVLTACAALLLLLAGPAAAQPKKFLTYKVSLGGMNAGIFTVFEVPTHGVLLTGDDVLVQPKTNGVDKRPIKLQQGKIGAFTQKVLTPKVGEQMTVEVEVVPVGAAPGKRCTFVLNHAKLKSVNGAELVLVPSELPKFHCTGDKKAEPAPAPDAK